MQKGTLHKMIVENQGTESVVRPSYSLVLDQTAIAINNRVGQELYLYYLGIINCIKCGRKTSKSFGQGYCYPCFISIPETEECVFRPELCRAHLGEARDMVFATQHCLIDHFVYLAWSGGLKVGVTRHHQIPTRWVDQGATKTIIVCRTSNRYKAGLVEVALKQLFADKTNWQSMLKGYTDDSINLVDEKMKALEHIRSNELEITTTNDTVYSIQYPVERMPLKVKSLSFDKQSEIGGVLTGIKGQYLIFNNEQVINIRNYAGYLVELK